MSTSANTTPKASVLLVEDNPADADLIIERVSDEINRPLAIEHVENLSAAVEILKHETFDAVVLDLGLPDSNGIETLVRILECSRNQPILVMTGNDDLATAQACLNLGAADYIIKTQVNGCISSQVYNALSRTKLEQELRFYSRILDLLNSTADGHSLFAGVASEIRAFFHADGVGIRLRKGDDYPYYEYSGFDADFIERETSLCYTAKGDCTGAGSTQALACICGSVIRGGASPSHPWLSKSGSFWTNNITMLLEQFPEIAVSEHFRGTCAKVGYKSMALIPVKAQDEVVGLIQLNYEAANVFSPSRILLLEKIALPLGMAYARIQLESQLITNETQLRSLVDGIPDIVMRFDGECRHLFASSNVEDLLGIPDTAFIGKTHRELGFPPEKCEFIEMLIRQAFESGEPLEEEIAIDALNGARVLDWRLVPEPDEKGAVVSVLTIARDITEIKKTEESRRVALEEFRTLAEYSPIAIYKADENGNCSYVNPRWLAMSGMEPEEAVGEGWVKAIHPDDRARVTESWKAFIEKKKEWECIYKIKSKDGAIATVYATANAIRDDKGEITGIIGCNLDMTERLNWEEQLADLARFPEENPGPVLRFSRDGALLYANPTSEYILELMQFDNGKLAGQSKAEMDAIIRAGRETVMSINGNGRYYEVVVVPVAERNYVNFYGEDVTSRVSAEKALNEANARSIRQQRLSALGQMASGIAHDFNNSLMPIIGFSDLILAKPEQYLCDKEEMLSMLTQILDAAEDAKKIVQRLRLIHRREEDEAKEPVNINELVESSIALTRPLWKEQRTAEGYDIRVKTDLTSSSRPVFADASEIREMLMNLIMNAVDALVTDGVIEITTIAEPSFMLLEVRDNGVGMSAETRAKCQEPFFSTKGAKGTGLGLAMVNGIVERHNGDIEIISDEGVGTVVRISLPYHVDSSSTESSAAKEDARPISPVRILLVDDDQRTVNLASRLLQKDSHSVTALTSARKALDVLFTCAGDYDLLISDRAMPDVRGDDLLTVAKQNNPDIGTIMITGFADIMRDNGECPDSCDLVMAKPFTLSMIRNALQELKARGRLVPKR